MLVLAIIIHATEITAKIGYLKLTLKMHLATKLVIDNKTPVSNK
jgi:hypothetical protein